MKTLRALSLGGCALLAGVCSCSQDNSDFVYVVTAGAASGGTVFSYGADSSSAYLQLIGDHTYPSGGINAVAAIATSDAHYMFVVNRDDDTVVSFGVRVGEGTITPLSTINTAGTQPVAVAMDASNSYLYVVDTLAPGFSSVNPGYGDVTVFSIGANAALTQIGYYPVGNTPQGVGVLPDGSGLFVANSADSTVSVFAANGSPAGGYTNTATYSTGSATSPYAVLVASSIVYVSDFANASITSYAPSGAGASLTLSPINAVAADVNPAALITDPTGKFLYSANSGAQNVSEFAINGDGSLAPLMVCGTGGDQLCVGIGGTSPRSLAVTPQGGPFLYAGGYIDNTVSASYIETDGHLTPVPRSPFQILGNHVSALVAIARNPATK